MKLERLEDDAGVGRPLSEVPVFVVDEAMDRALLAAMAQKDQTAICNWPERIFQSGTSEIKTWIVLAGAMEQTALQMRLIDYVTCYRSLAGTGVGAGFAEWM